MEKIKLNKERKYILIVGCILIFLGVIYRFYPNLEGMFSANDELILRQQKINKYKDIASQRDYQENRLSLLNRVIERSEIILLNGETASLAAVDLQNIIKDITGRSGIEIKAMRVLKTESLDGGNYSKIPVEITFESTIRQLKEVIYKIESYSKLLTIFDVKTRNNRMKDRWKIKTTLTVSGLMKNS